MINKIIKKSVAIMMLLSMIFSSISNIVFAATPISEAYIQDRGDCGYHLQYYNQERGAWSYIKCNYVVFNKDGKDYPAYCLQQNLHGVGDQDNYTVDIDKTIDDVRVWRTIVNSYPYKTPAEIGVANEYDAFVATKQAVYCILYDWDPAARYRGGDARGTAIANAIVNLVNIGRNGTQTPYTAGLSANKVGGFTKDGNYYKQEYSISCGVGASEYRILSTSGMPDGAIITDTNGNQKTSFSASENFVVKIPTSQMTKDINIVLNLQGKAKTYPIFYGRTRISGTQDYAVTYDPLGDVVGIANLNVKPNTGKIQINKTDDETSKAISGVTFQLNRTDGTVVASATTNEKGVATFSGLYPADYKLKETSTNKNYVLNNKEFDVNVKFDETATVNVTNTHKKGNLQIYKTGKWYNLADDTQIKIKWNETTNSTIENELQKGQIKVIKIDMDNKEVKLKGVKFDVLDEKGKVLETITSNEKGEAYTSRYALRDYGKLTIREKETLQEYVLNDKPQTVELKANQIKTITFENEKKKAQIKIIKVDLDNKEVKLEGVKFDIKDEKGNVVDTIVTDKNGEATTKRLPIDQKYTAVETSTKKEYVLTKETQTVTLKQDEIKNITFQNEKRKGQLRVIKVDKDNNEVLLQGVKFEIKDEKGKVVDEVVTDEKGEATTKRLPIDQKYTVVETSTKKEYVLTDETQTVELKENEITSIKFDNEKIKGYVEITKVDSKTKETLQGASFGIYDENNKEVEKLTTDEKGKATSKLLPYGKYYLKELDTGSPYYLLNEDTFKFEIVENHKTVPVTVENDSVDIEVTVDKKGTTEIKPGEKVNYEFENVGNASNIYLENFKWFDYIPTDYIRLETMTTGTWNQDLTYSVYYKTNKSEDYILRYKDLKTTEDHLLDFTDVELAEDEYIIETMFDFGKVDVGFKEDIKPTMECKSFDTLKDNDTFTNKTKTVGVYFGVTAEANSKWTTITHIPEEKHEVKLPKTGK